jgi:hypothetical protein
VAGEVSARDRQDRSKKVTGLGSMSRREWFLLYMLGLVTMLAIYVLFVR